LAWLEEGDIMIGIVIGIVWFVLTAIVVYLLATAPDGWEDESGYHSGKRPNE
jgi:hypothetical protein